MGQANRAHRGQLEAEGVTSRWIVFCGTTKRKRRGRIGGNVSSSLVSTSSTRTKQHRCLDVGPDETSTVCVPIFARTSSFPDPFTSSTCTLFPSIRKPESTLTRIANANRSSLVINRIRPPRFIAIFLVTQRKLVLSRSINHHSPKPPQPLRTRSHKLYLCRLDPSRFSLPPSRPRETSSSTFTRIPTSSTSNPSSRAFSFLL